jgi:hypothetical protein
LSKGLPAADYIASTDNAQVRELVGDFLEGRCQIGAGGVPIKLRGLTVGTLRKRESDEQALRASISLFSVESADERSRETVMTMTPAALALVQSVAKRWLSARV